MPRTPAGSAPAPAAGLSFATTVDLALLHRRNPSEAFLTGAVRTGPDRFDAAALLPPEHPHYAGHTGPSRRRDPMLLLECARQAETYAAHALFGVEPDAHFVLRNWSAEFFPAPADSPDGIADASEPDASVPTELLITAVTANPRVVRDRVRGLDYQLELWADGALAGRVRMEVGYLSHPAYLVVRSRQHPGGLPSSDDLLPDGPSPDGCRPAPPARVGRTRATDTVLLDVASGPRTVTARLRTPVENASLFDHAQDHIPAMVLVEAARQLAALATEQWGGPAPERTRMTAMSSSFSAYAELAEPIELTATPATAPTTIPTATPTAIAGAVEVSFRQAGAEIAQAQITMTGHQPESGMTWLGPPS